MKSILNILLLLIFPFLVSAQIQNYEDSLLSELQHATNDTIRMSLNRQIGFYHQDSDADKALAYHEAQLALAKKLNLKLWEADAYQQIAYCYSSRFRLPLAYENYQLALEIAEDPSSAENGWGYSNFSYSKSPDEARQSIVGMIHFELGTFYTNTRDYKEVLRHLEKAVEIGEHLKNQKILSLANRDIATYYYNNNSFDTGMIYTREAWKHFQNSPYQKNLGSIYDQMGQYFVQKQMYDSAKFSFYKGIDVSTDPASMRLLSRLKGHLGEMYLETGRLDSALTYISEAKMLSDSINDPLGSSHNLTRLSAIYKAKKEYATAFDYLEQGKNLSDSLANAYVDKLLQFQNLDFSQKIRLQELEKQQQVEKSRNRMFLLIAGLAIFLLVALLLYRNNRQKQKANKVLESTLANLRATQSQLVQSEKMASLGELTAGIAHEIQNPLNFVNNFSEVNKEMLAEMREEIEKKNFDEVSSIAKNVEENEEKIIFHGKRADAIVKGMLQHSRSSNGVEEPTDINALCDEYLRLAYHGLRAKDKSFNAKFETDFDSSIGNLDVVSQDIGRVILNLINNAFYAVNEKAKKSVVGYQPTVIVSTKKQNGKVEISIKDNGSGIPDSIKEKIFQPFFSTKPTGSGTGLGLSLSYDIVKAHGGELKVEASQEGGSIFIIQLPVS